MYIERLVIIYKHIGSDHHTAQCQEIFRKIGG